MTAVDSPVPCPVTNTNGFAADGEPSTDRRVNMQTRAQGITTRATRYFLVIGTTATGAHRANSGATKSRACT